MASFTGYKKVIYDANCIIYLCFKTEEQGKSGNLVVIDSPPFTELTCRLTEYLKTYNKIICTLKLVFDEIASLNLAEAVKERTSDQDIRDALGLSRGEKFPEHIEYKIVRNMKKKLIKLQYEEWFEIDPNYLANPQSISEVRNFFRAMFNNPTIQPRFKPHKSPIPSRPDISLILYSRDTLFPLISNDRHIYEFKEELANSNYTHKIIPLLECNSIE